MEHPIYSYRRYFVLVGIPAFLIAALFPLLQALFIIMFFLVTLNVMFEAEQDRYDLAHSTKAHQAIHTRHNWLNYTLAGILVLEGMLIAFGIANGFALAFICWALNAAIFSWLLGRAEQNLSERLIADYLIKQDLPLDFRTALDAIHVWIMDPDISDTRFSEILGVDEETASEIIHYIQTYFGTVEVEIPVSEAQ